MGRIKVEVPGLRSILSEYIGASLLNEACAGVADFIKWNTEISIHISRMQEELEVTLVPGDSVDLHHHFEIEVVVVRSPMTIGDGQVCLSGSRASSAE